MEEYGVTVKYLPGIQNIAVDALFRRLIVTKPDTQNIAVDALSWLLFTTNKNNIMSTLIHENNAINKVIKYPVVFKKHQAMGANKRDLYALQTVHAKN